MHSSVIVMAIGYGLFSRPARKIFSEGGPNIPVTQLPFAQRLGAFVQVGHVFGLFERSATWPGFSCGLSGDEFTAFEHAIHRAGVVNGWFTPANVQHMLGSLATMLEEHQLRSWLPNPPAPATQRSIGIIMAGNIPMVGFHDLLCVVLAGHRARVKLSSQDNVLIPAALELLERFSPGIKEVVTVDDGKLGAVDAIIATGSNNTARYFEHYFRHLPRLLRKGRVSVAVLDESESDTELIALGEDVFRYFGLGCRNVSKLYVPRDFDLDRFFGAIYPWKDIVNHNKYGNNYDYNKAVWLLERIPLVENGFVLVREAEALASPVASIHFERYDDRAAVLLELEARRDGIQCIVGHGHIPFGRSQYPAVDDYADGMDTMAFLRSV
jgi:Acyl-CoA reductase (LuxC)